ncbi:MAG: hypothetical protein ACRD4K_08270 [Candidatus Acidiferrales bacterium]
MHQNRRAPVCLNLGWNRLAPTKASEQDFSSSCFLHYSKEIIIGIERNTALADQQIKIRARGAGNVQAKKLDASQGIRRYLSGCERCEKQDKNDVLGPEAHDPPSVGSNM